MPIYGPDGKVLSSVENKKAAPPVMGNAFGHWAGRDLEFLQLPGGGIIQFDLSKLTLADFRAMRDHYQVNASLAVLSFMQHQADWHIECPVQKIATYCEEQLRNNWTMLNRAMSTANWAGFSPNVLEWENDIPNRQVVLDKIKDLTPEECRVEWKEVEGWAPPGRTPPKFKIFDGIKQFGMGWPIPVDNSFWYPMLMENGDYSGRKLLRPAFTSWFFSILIHLFSNRYYERFGEPTPIGRAPYDEELDVDGNRVKGNEYLLTILSQLRSRGVVVLPNDKSQVGDGNTTEYDYTIDYLESQMRGADFERYLTRLDEEISLALFTPILLLRTADVGSYNLGVGHMQMYLWMLNAMNDDRALYIDKYILRRMVNFQFGENAPDAKIKFRKLGNTSSEMLKEMLVALIQNGGVRPDIKELGQMAGMTLHEIEQTTEPAPEGDDDTDGPTDPEPVALSRRSEVYATAKEVEDRVRSQVNKAWTSGNFGSELKINMGYKRKMEKSLEAAGIQEPVTVANQMYENLDAWLADVVALGSDEFSGPESFVDLFARVLQNEVVRVLA